MTTTIDYYFGPQSPWTYLGHQRLVDMAQAADAKIRVRPMDMARVFAASGGVQLKDRPKQRQDYRLVELARHRDYLGVPLVVQPKFFPVVPTMASKLIIAVEQAVGEAAALKLSGALMAAVWVQERNIADEQTLSTILGECQLPHDCLMQVESAAVGATYDDYTQTAIDLGVFGAPTYVVNGELFWGQDRLMFVAQALQTS